MLPEMQDYLSDKDRERFVHLYNNLYFQVIEEADVIITRYQTLRVEDWDREKLWSLSQTFQILIYISEDDSQLRTAYDKFSG